MGELQPAQEKKTGEKPKRVWVKRVIAVSVGLGIATLSFLGGFFTRQWTLDEDLQTITDVKNRVQQSYYKEITDEQFYDALLDGLSTHLLDPYSTYMNKEETAEYKAHGAGKYEGVGLAFLSSAKGAESLKIMRVAGNSPAENAGIVAGRYVVGVSAKDEEMQPVAEYNVFINQILTFESGTEFYLYTRKNLADTQMQKHLVKRASYTENYVYYRSSTDAYRFTGDNSAEANAWGDALTALPEHTAYIRLTQFNGNANKAFDSAMSIFKQDGKKNLVLDLRGNGGGYLDIMCDIAKYFCKTATEKKPVVAYAQYSDKREPYKATGNVYSEYFADDSKIYVLADSSSASASECLLGVMIDYGATAYENICLSKRDGVAKTYGKGIMQVTFVLSLLRGDTMKLTTAKILWPSLNCIHDRGILLEDGTKTVDEQPYEDAEIIDALQQFGL
ncbi:MAG: hypothetical protein IJ996_00645 [Clostridia bacterium]|nr:hypothetical protein [Clostridia bacterium]